MLKNKPFSYALAFCLIALLALAGCGGKNKAATDALMKYTPDEEEVLDEDYTPRDDGKPLSSDELHAFKTLGQIDRDMSLEDSQTVELHFKYFVHDKRGTFQRFLERSARFLPYMKKTFSDRGIPVELVYISMAESGGNPVAISPAGAVGLWQFMPFTGRKYGLQQNTWIDERRDPFKATYAASDYLLKLYNDFNNWHLAMAAYNAGEGKIGRVMEGTGANNFFDICRLDEKLDYKTRLRDETRNYVPRIIAIAKIMRNLKRLGFTEPSPDVVYDLRPVTVSPGTNLASLARTLELTWDEFTSMNPAFKRTASPPTLETIAYVPPEKVGQAVMWLASNESRSFADWKEYTVGKKDTLNSVARKFGVTQAALREANGFTNLPKAGNTILIPGKSSQVIEPVYAAREDKSNLAAKSSGKYTVRAGDTLYSLAQRWGTDEASIRLANRMGKSNALSIGQRLTIPGNSKTPTAKASGKQSRASSGPSTKSASPQVVSSTSGKYSVKSGDTIGAIAQAHGLSTKALLDANNMSAKSTIRVGQTLTIPGKATPASVHPSNDTTTKKATAQTAKAQTTGKSSSKGRTVTIAKGDTLYSLAKKHGVSVDALRKANGLGEKAAIKIGQKITLP